MFARIPMRGGAEHDALPPRAKRLFRWLPGARRRCKRFYGRRFRRLARLELKAALAETEAESVAPA